MAQKLKVINETSKTSGNKLVQKIHRDKKNNHATLCFESSVTGLQIISNANDSTWTEKVDGATRYYFDIDLNEYKTEVDGIVFITSAPRYRELILRSPESQDFLLKTEELLPNVYYYKVILPDKFPVAISGEYVFSSHYSSRLKGINNSGASWSIHSKISGLKIAYGGRYGYYFSFKWGDYRPAGQNIDNATIDCDVSQAEYLGIIRRSVVVGSKIGILNIPWIPIYIYVGGGYGEYGRQWENPSIVFDNKYFHSDYIKGFNGDIGISISLLSFFSLSFGADMVVGNGKMSVDYQMGIGLCINQTLFRHKTNR